MQLLDGHKTETAFSAICEQRILEQTTRAPLRPTPSDMELSVHHDASPIRVCSSQERRLTVKKLRGLLLSYRQAGSQRLPIGAFSVRARWHSGK